MTLNEQLDEADRNAEISRCCNAHAKLVYDAKYEAAQLRAALDMCLTGGNHIASQLVERLGGGFAERFPPDMAHIDALEAIGATVEYDMWCCWSAMMQVRDELVK